MLWHYYIISGIPLCEMDSRKILSQWNKNLASQLQMHY